MGFFYSFSKLCYSVYKYLKKKYICVLNFHFFLNIKSFMRMSLHLVSPFLERVLSLAVFFPLMSMSLDLNVGNGERLIRIKINSPTEIDIVSLKVPGKI